MACRNTRGWQCGKSWSARVQYAPPARVVELVDTLALTYLEGYQCRKAWEFSGLSLALILLTRYRSLKIDPVDFVESPLSRLYNVLKREWWNW